MKRVQASLRIHAPHKAAMLKLSEHFAFVAAMLRLLANLAFMAAMLKLFLHLPNIGTLVNIYNAFVCYTQRKNGFRQSRETLSKEDSSAPLTARVDTAP